MVTVFVGVIIAKAAAKILLVLWWIWSLMANGHCTAAESHASLWRGIMYGLQEMAAYKSGGGGIKKAAKAPPKPAPKPVEEDEEDDEDEDDEEDEESD